MGTLTNQYNQRLIGSGNWKLLPCHDLVFVLASSRACGGRTDFRGETLASDLRSCKEGQGEISDICCVLAHGACRSIS